ncbi:MAG: FtsX-like permease family protein [Bacteroidota bacterium]
MLRHHFILFFRNIKKNTNTFLINLTGLSTGLACVLLIYLWVTDELGMDKFNKNDAQLYQVMQSFQFESSIETQEMTPVPLGKALLEEMPEVEHAVAINDFFSWQSGREGVLSNGDKRIKASGWHAGTDFFKVFSHGLLHGDKNRVLADKNSIVLSQSLSEKIFGTTENIVGRTLEWSHPSFEGIFQVSGVFEDPPINATGRFDFLISMEILLEKLPWTNGWGGSAAETFLVLKKGTDVDRFNKKIEFFTHSRENSDDNNSLFVQQYSKRYLYGQYENGKPVAGRIAYVGLFSIVALFILLIACINFINLSTALASRKMKEIGIKKSMGANRRALIFQFMGESMSMAFLSLVVAVLLVVLLLPQFNEIAGKQLYLNIGLGDVLFLTGIVLATGFISGVYPAFYLSGFKPVKVLKGKLDKSSGEIWARKGLVIFQFALSIIFIVGLLIVDRQIDFAQTKNMGYSRGQIVSFEWKGKLYSKRELSNGKSNERFYTLMSSIKEVPGVVNATNMSGNILNEIYGQSDISWRGEDSDRDFLFQSPVVGFEFIETLGIELKEGRTFSRNYNDDYSKIILNEAAVKKMGLENPVGKIIDMNGGSQIVGVVGDFHYGSLHNHIEPLIFRFDPYGRNIMVKIKAGTERATLERLEKVNSEFMPEFPFEYTFMDDDYQALYESEERVAVLSRYFSALAIIISSLGLFGLATFTALQRRKEIGIRKVLGQTAAQVTVMLSGEFAKLVLVSILIALPVSYLCVDNWLSGFAYRIPLRSWYFLGAGSVALLVALLTVGSQAIRAANRNPVEALKEE